MKPRVVARLIYDPRKDGNVFDWILGAAETYRHIKKEHANALKKAAAKPEGLDGAKMADQKW
jgi:hypothetical protein